MQRRRESGQPVKRRRTIGRKARKAPTAPVSTTDLQEQVAALTRELKEAREQQTARRRCYASFPVRRASSTPYSRRCLRRQLGSAGPPLARCYCSSATHSDVSRPIMLPTSMSSSLTESLLFDWIEHVVSIASQKQRNRSRLQIWLRPSPIRPLRNWVARGHISRCQCSKKTSLSAPSVFTARRSGHSPTSRSNWSKTSQPRPLSQSRTPGYSTSASAHR